MNFRKQPLHGDVVKIRKLQQCLLFSFAGNSPGGLEVGEALSEEFKSNPGALASFQADMEEFEYKATIMLSTGLDEGSIDALTEDEFWKAHGKSKKALGSDASAFLDRYTQNTPSAAVKKPGSKTSGPSKEKSSSGP